MLAMDAHEDRGLLVVVDVDNLMSNVKGITPRTCPSWLSGQINVNQLGTVIYSFALADYRGHESTLDRALMLNGFFPIQCPKTLVHATKKYKDSVDQVAIELIHDILQKTPSIGTIVLVSGDRDFAPVLATWKKRGKEIVVLGYQGLSSELREVADRVIDTTGPKRNAVTPITATAKPGIVGFTNLLSSATTPDEFHQVTTEIAFIRDLVTSFFRTVVAPLVRAGNCHFLTKTFLMRELERYPQGRLSKMDALWLVQGLVGTALMSGTSSGDTPPYHAPDERSPFMRFCTKPV